MIEKGITDGSLSIPITFVLGNSSNAFEYPPPPKVQSRNIPPFWGFDSLMTSLNITGKWDNSRDDVWFFINL